MAASRATWALALVLIAACSMPSALAGVWGSYYSGGCGGFPSYSDCDGGWTCDGSNCLGKCTYGGYATATCMNGQWHVNVTCNAAPKKCSALPPSCEGITWTSDCYNKDKVYAYCGNGYTGVISATCVNGEWVLSGQCTKIISIPKPKTCAGTPPACEGANWVCDGYKCWGYCSNDYCGVVTAHCWDGQWVVEGYCRKVTYFPPKPKACSGMPRSCTGASWTCTDSKCYGFCGNGYTGSVNAYCWNGEWVVSGSCQKVTYVPPTQPTCGCAGLPPAVSGISWSPRCDGKSYCGANCMNGYCEGYVYSKCVNGVWSTPVGSCTPAIAVAPKKCHGKPKKQCNAYNWKCHHGKYCKAKCKWGCSGKGYKAKCEDGKWVVSGGCKQAWWSYGN